MKTFFQYLLVFIFVIVLIFIAINKKDFPVVILNDIQYVKIAGVSVKIDLAITPEAKSRGLSGRIFLLDNTGMLFIFPTSNLYPFWMKDMNFPIDIIWIAESKQVVYIQKNATPESYPAVFGGEVKAKYVLEVPANFTEKNNVKIGDSVTFY